MTSCLIIKFSLSCSFHCMKYWRLSVKSGDIFSHHLGVLSFHITYVLVETPITSPKTLGFPDENMGDLTQPFNLILHLKSKQTWWFHPISPILICNWPPIFFFQIGEGLISTLKYQAIKITCEVVQAVREEINRYSFQNYVNGPAEASLYYCRAKTQHINKMICVWYQTKATFPPL